MPLGPALAALAVVAVAVTSSMLSVSAADPLDSRSAALVAVVLILLSVISASGTLLARGRWARWLVIIVATDAALWSLISEVAPGWQIASSALALVAIVAAGPGSSTWFRKRPSAQGAPPAAVVLMLGLISFPALVAFANPTDISPLAIIGGVAALTAGVIYSRSGVPSLWVMRAMTPVGILLAVVGSSLPASLVVLAAGGALTALSWTPEVRQAAAPIVPLRSPGYRIPAELTPPEILDAAGLDDRGRRK